MRAMVFVGLIAVLTHAPVSLTHAQRQERIRPQAGGPPDRAMLERRLSERLATVVQRELALNDEQMRRLQEVNQRYESRRFELVRRERQTRIAMRQELMSGAPANEDRVAQLLVESSKIQRERLDLIDSEQNDLARFLTPSQRAKYLGIQEQMRRRIEEVRERPPFLDQPGTGRGPMGSARGRGRRPPP